MKQFCYIKFNLLKQLLKLGMQYVIRTKNTKKQVQERETKPAENKLQHSCQMSAPHRWVLGATNKAIILQRHSPQGPDSGTDRCHQAERLAGNL